MNKFCNLKLHKRPAFLVGLFLILTATDLSAFNNTLIGTIGDIFYSPPPPLLNLPNHTQLRIKKLYSPIFYRKDITKNDTSLVQSDNQGSRLDFFFPIAKLAAFATFNHSSFQTYFRNNDYQVKNIQDFWTISAGATGTYKNLTLGFHLGKHIPQNPFYLQRINSFTLQSENLWQVGVSGKLKFQLLNITISAYNGPVYSSIASISKIDQSGFRTFPLCINDKSLSGSVQLTSDNIMLNITTDVTSLNNTQLIKSENSMPSDIALNIYKTSLHGIAFPGFCDSLFWNLQIVKSGGWIASYNFNKDRFTFLRADSLISNLMNFSTGLKLPYQITISSNTSIFNINGPSGFLKLTPFSDWSVFQILDYKFNNLLLKYLESGISINKQLQHERLTFIPQLNVSYFGTSMNWEYSQKRIVVLLPVYTENKKHNVWNLKGLLFKPSAEITIRTSPITLNFETAQYIPLLFKPKSSVYDPLSDSLSIKKPTQYTSHSVTTWGGTRLSMSVIWDIAGN